MNRILVFFLALVLGSLSANAFVTPERCPMHWLDLGCKASDFACGYSGAELFFSSHTSYPDRSCPRSRAPFRCCVSGYGLPARNLDSK